MAERPQRSDQYLRLNAAHSEIIDALEAAKQDFHLADHDFPEMELKVGERALSASMVNELFEQDQIPDEEHHAVLLAMNQQTKQPLSRLKSSYDLLMEDTEHSATRAALQTALDESLELFNFLVEVAANVSEYCFRQSQTPAGEDESDDAEIRRTLLRQYLDFQKTFNMFGDYINRTTQFFRAEKQ